MLNHIIKEITKLGKLVKSKNWSDFGSRFRKCNCRIIYELQNGEISISSKISPSLTILRFEKIDFSIDEKWNDF